MLNTAQNPLKQKLKGAFVVLFTLYLMVGTLLYFVQEKLMFLPTKLAQNYEYEFSHPFEELFFKTEEDALINAVHFKLENPKGVVLFFHGNAGDLSRWGIIAESFVEKQYDVLIMDYRTYGKSKGKLSEEALYHDAQYCYDYLKNNYNENEITVYGRSLGSGMATYIASKNKPKQLILETPFHSVLDVAKSRFPMLPVKQLLKYKLPNYQYINQVACSITILHGTEDTVVPYTSAKKLFEVAAKNQTTFVTIKGGSHGNLSAFDSYQQQIDLVLK